MSPLRRRSSGVAGLLGPGDGVHGGDVGGDDGEGAVVGAHAVSPGPHTSVVPVPEQRTRQVTLCGGSLCVRTSWLSDRPNVSYCLCLFSVICGGTHRHGVPRHLCGIV